MNTILSVKAMRESDAKTIADGIPGRELMFRAGKAIFALVQWKPPVAVLCGSGNNAGDGYVIALLLREAGIPCEIIRLGDRCSEDGGYYLSRCREAGIPDRRWETGTTLEEYGTIADCLFGTGFHGRAERREFDLLHLLERLVDDDFAGMGFAKKLVAYAADISRSLGKKVIRLDVLKGNLPADKLYLKCGFDFIGEQKIYYEDTGLADFRLYEMVL